MQWQWLVPSRREFDWIVSDAGENVGLGCLFHHNLCARCAEWLMDVGQLPGLGGRDVLFVFRLPVLAREEIPYPSSLSLGYLVSFPHLKT